MVFYTTRTATQAHLQSSKLGHWVVVGYLCVYGGDPALAPLNWRTKSGVGKVGESKYVLGPEQYFLSKYVKRMAS